MQTRVSLAATRFTCAITRRMVSPFQTISCFTETACQFAVFALEAA